MLRAVTLLALVSTLFAAGTVVAKPNDGKPPRSQPKKAPKTAPPKSDRVDSVPAVPEGLKVLWVTPMDFASRSDVEMVERGLWPKIVYEPNEKRDGWATAMVRLPAGARIEWLDCQLFFYSSVDNPGESGAQVRLAGYDYRNGNSLANIYLLLTTGPGRRGRYPETYWKGTAIDGAQARRENAEQYFLLEAHLYSYHAASYEFFGCRVGYRPRSA